MPAKIRTRFWSRSLALRIAAGILIGSSIVMPVIAQEDEEVTETEVVMPADTAEALPADSAEALPAETESTAAAIEENAAQPVPDQLHNTFPQPPVFPRQAPTPIR